MISPETIPLERIIRSFIAEGSGLDPQNVIPGNENAPSPNDPYATCLLLSDEEQGVDQTIVTNSTVDDSANVQITGSRLARYSVQFYRKGAVDYAKRFRKYKSTPLGQVFLTKNNITLKIGSNILRIDAIISDEFEERARIEIYVRYLDSLVQSLNTIGTVNVGTCHQDGEGLTLNEEVQINDT